MTNGENGKLLGNEVLRGLARVYGWPGFQPATKAVAQIDPALFARYEGRYRYREAPDWGAVVVQEGDRLFWEDTPDGLRWSCSPSQRRPFSLSNTDRGLPLSGKPDGSVETVLVGEYERVERVG